MTPVRPSSMHFRCPLSARHAPKSRPLADRADCGVRPEDPPEQTDRVYDGSATLESDREVAEFSQYTKVDVALTIKSEDVTDLSPLDGLREVGGRLEITGRRRSSFGIISS